MREYYQTLFPPYFFLANTMGNLLENPKSKRIVCFHAERKMNGPSVCSSVLDFTALHNTGSLLLIKQCCTSKTELITLGQDGLKKPESQNYNG